MKAIYQLIKKMGCNYVSIFYDFNSYSINLKNDLQTLIQNNDDPGICVNSFNQFQYNGTNQDQIDLMLKDMLNLYENSINHEEDPVIIYIGYQVTYSVLLNKLNNIALNTDAFKSIHLISSDAVEKFLINGTKSDKIKFYSLSFKESNINKDPEFLNYYKKLLDSISKTNDTKSLPWIDEYLKIKNNCSLFNNSIFPECNTSNIYEITNSQYLTYSMYSVYIFYEKLKVYSIALCPTTNNVDDCALLPNDSSLPNFTEYLRKADFNFQNYDLMWKEIRVL